MAQLCQLRSRERAHIVGKVQPRQFQPHPTILPRLRSEACGDIMISN
jgi:hypothetical protein